MSVLFDDSRVNTRPFCSGASLWLSVAMHATVAIALIVVPFRAFEKPSTPPSRSRTVFIMPAAAVITPPVRIAVPRLAAPPKPKPTSPIADAAVPPPPPVAPIVARAVEPAAAPKVVAVPERPVERPETRRPLETGLFERTNVARTTQVAAAVTTGGFGTPAMVARDASTAGAVKTGGFGSDAAAPRRTADGEVRTAGFDQRASAPAPASVPAPKSVDRPVEIVFKPSPEYTEEARRARIEGTVSLELEFTAAGDVRVLRIVSGLGHGLDEAAQRAALRIRFKPAQSDGTPVDSRATVHITFRLS